LQSYYNNILINKKSLSTVKSFNINLYTVIFIDIITTIFANHYYNGFQINFNNYTQDNEYYISVINQVINLYLNYNFNFRLNKNINNNTNLLIQKIYNKTVSFTSYTEIFDYLVSLYYYELLSDNIANINISSSNYDIILFFKNLNIYQNYNFQYIFNIVNYFFRLQSSIILLVNIINYNINITSNLKLTYDYDSLHSIIIDYLNLVVNHINIIKFLNIQSVDNIYTKILYNNITNIIEFDDFVTRLNDSLLQILYYENNICYQNVIINAWTYYFKDYDFTYYYYSFNDYTIKNFTLSFKNFELIIYDYINYYILNTNQINNYSIIQRITNYIINIINPISSNYEFIFNTINNILFNNNFVSSNEYVIINSYNDYLLRFNNIVSKIEFILKNIFWGYIYYNTTSNVNTNLQLQLLFFNFYYVYINQPNYYTTDFITQYIKNNYKLYIIYYIINSVIILNYINDDTYNNIFNISLTKCHNFNLFGCDIQSFDLNNNIAIKLDFLNKNIFPNNLINNYYKNIQDDTISDIIKYNVSNFINPSINFNNTLNSIFDIIVNQFNFKTETQIGGVFYNNLMTCLINNYALTIDIIEVGKPGEIIYINNIYTYLLSNINDNLTTFKNILGGYDKDINNINLTTNNLIQIYNQKVFEINNKPITIFTLLYNEFNKLVNNDMSVILFYYTCFITWLSINGNNYNNTDKLIYEFSNLINTNITKYVEITNIESFNNLTETQKYELNNLETFFNGLNLILFNLYNNLEFSNLSSDFFNLYIKNNTTYSNESNDVKFNISTYNGISIPSNIVLLQKQYFNKQTYDALIKNNKILTWKFMQGIIIDYNFSDVTNSLKSIIDIDNILNINNEYIKYISLLNNGIINKFGVIKMIDTIKLLFDDELIDNYNNNMYKIFINLFVNLNKFGLIYEMLGLNYDSNNQDYMLNGLKPYILNFKSKNFILPLNFFFKDNNNVIPLIACMYTQVKVDLYISSNNVIKNSYITNYLTNPNIETSLNMDFILVEKEERIQICSKLIDNLIEKHGSYSNSVILTQDMLNTYTDLITLKFNFTIPYVIKELFWTLDFYINNYSLYNKSNYNSSAQNIYDFILNTRFYIDGSRRDGVQSLTKQNYNTITTIINPYKYNTRAYSSNNYFYNVYSFGLEPENFQPTGAFNLSKFNIFTIELIIDKNKLYNYINNFSNLYDLNRLTITMNLNTLEYNLVRYQSGLSGLLFV